MKKLAAMTLCLALVLTGAAAAMADGIFTEGTPTVYIGYGAGGGTDIAVRPIVAEMSDYLHENIECINMEGANSAVACDYVLEQDHDGYSMFATGTGGFSSYPIYKYSKSGWQDWISFHAYLGPAVVFASKDSGITTTDQLFEYLAEGNSFGIGAYGNGPHTQFEAICAARGIDAPYYRVFGSCADAAEGCISGDVMAGAGSLSSVIDYLNADLLKPIFVTGEEPFTFTGIGVTSPSVTTEVAGTEDVPKLNETWPIMIPRDAPQEIIDALTEAFEYALTTDAVKNFAAENGFCIIGLTGEEADRFLSYSVSGYSWTLYNAGLGEGNPADFGIPTLEEYDWETVKKTCEAYQ